MVICLEAGQTIMKNGEAGHITREMIYNIGDMTNWTISTLAGALTGAFGIFLGPLINRVGNTYL